MAEEDIDIASLAISPKMAENENGKVQSHDLDDMIAAARFVGNKKATKGRSPFSIGNSVAISAGTR